MKILVDFIKRSILVAFALYTYNYFLFNKFPIIPINIINILIVSIFDIFGLVGLIIFYYFL
ncbi:MAG: pro-sigmaK processing inhibitor BofA family protein [Bacilli bacterium]|nr:pro-sigmaK processing inhibitor BofA family protein [Bacilli bacterium]